MVTDLEDMSRECRVRQIASFIVVLLLHLIKRNAAAHSTRSWDVSIANAVVEINEVQQSRNTKNALLGEQELAALLHNQYRRSLNVASLEAFGGIDVPDLEKKVNEDAIVSIALELLQSAA